MKNSTPTSSPKLLSLIGFVFLTLAFFLAVPRAPASDSPHATFLKSVLVEAPETAFPLGNTADGSGALQNLTTGYWNSAFGDRALNQNTTGAVNNAIQVSPQDVHRAVRGKHKVLDAVQEQGILQLAEVAPYADEALYSAKRAGRDRYALWQPFMGELDATPAL